MKKTEFACVIYTITILFLLAACVQKKPADVRLFNESATIIGEQLDIIRDEPKNEAGFRLYKVEADENIFDISRKFKIEMAVIIELNEMQAPFRFKNGEVIRLPLESAAKEIQTKKEIALPKPKPQINEKAKKTISSGNFMWPYRGVVISEYGPKSGGIFNNGINIKTSKNAEIKSADGGEVIYSGKDIKGFGSLVIIKHSDEWISTYSLGSAKVKEGELVSKNQVIGTSGNSPDGKGPQIHFALRKGKNLVNPLDYIIAN